MKYIIVKYEGDQYELFREHDGTIHRCEHYYYSLLDLAYNALNFNEDEFYISHYATTHHHWDDLEDVYEQFGPFILSTITHEQLELLAI
jgi:hypothetical protein